MQLSQKHPLDPRLTLRLATENDIDGLADVGSTGGPGDEGFLFDKPYYKEFPEDEAYWRRVLYTSFLDAAEKYVFLVVTAQDHGEPDGKGRVVAIAIWNVNVRLSVDMGDLGVPDDPSVPLKRRDVDRDAFVEMEHRLKWAAQTYFYEPYSPNYFQLQSLVTHPSYRRRGAATRLIRWGLDKAAVHKMPVAVLGSTMGRMVYQTLGFDLIDYVEIRHPKDPSNVVTIAVMIAFHPKRKDEWDADEKEADEKEADEKDVDEKMKKKLLLSSPSSSSSSPSLGEEKQRTGFHKLIEIKDPKEAPTLHPGADVDTKLNLEGWKA